MKYCPECGDVRISQNIICKCGYRFSNNKTQENFIKKCWLCESTKDLELQPGTAGKYLCNECAYQKFLENTGYGKRLAAQRNSIGVDKEISGN